MFVDKRYLRSQWSECMQRATCNARKPRTALHSQDGKGLQCPGHLQAPTRQNHGIWRDRAGSIGVRWLACWLTEPVGTSTNLDNMPGPFPHNVVQQSAGQRVFRGGIWRANARVCKNLFLLYVGTPGNLSAPMVRAQTVHLCAGTRTFWLWVNSKISVASCSGSACTRAAHNMIADT